jgi:hypothetical protein
MPVQTPYEDTAVSVERSQGTIRKRLQMVGALGVSFDEVWEEPRALLCRFVWPILRESDDELVKMVVRIRVHPLPPVRLQRGAGWKVSPEQRDRQAWRGIAHYLDATLKAAEFGLVRFEDVFLSFIEAPDGTTVGEAVIPVLRDGGRLQLGPAPRD